MTSVKHVEKGGLTLRQNTQHTISMGQTIWPLQSSCSASEQTMRVSLSMGHTRPLLYLFSPFQTNITIFATNIC